MEDGGDRCVQQEEQWGGRQGHPVRHSHYNNPLNQPGQEEHVHVQQPREEHLQLIGDTFHTGQLCSQVRQ